MKRSGPRRKRPPGRTLLRILRRMFPRLGRISPRLSARLAERLFCTPPRHRRLKREERVLAAGRSLRVAVNGGTVPTWTWGRGPVVLLVHGWGGHAGRLTPFVAPLVRSGFTVVAFDAPGHGAAGRCRSSLMEFVDAVQAVAGSHGPIEGLIAHSLGAAACGLALRGGLPARRAVLLAPPADLEKYPGRFARSFRMPPTTRDHMKARLARRYRFEWPELKVHGGNCPTRLLVFHDRRDGKVPFSEGLEIVRGWRYAELVRTRGLGHHRILRDRRVIARAVAFLAGRPAFRAARSAARERLPLRPAFAS